jgi:hypothetical protein
VPHIEMGNTVEEASLVGKRAGDLMRQSNGDVE